MMVPIFVMFGITSHMQRSGWQTAACVSFCLAAATDYVDGWIARSWDLVTSFGKVADPIADKALIGSALILLSAYDRVPVWMTAVIMFRELGVTGLRFWVIRRAVIAASRGGKIKTALQVLAIAWCLAPVSAGRSTVGWWLMVAATLVTVGTGLDYVLRAVRVRRAAMPVVPVLPTSTTPGAEEAA
jgi:CDP-diacylglycerol---glycerol-3-phosphate 3-phosphatidyltransferase